MYHIVICFKTYEKWVSSFEWFKRKPLGAVAYHNTENKNMRSLLICLILIHIEPVINDKNKPNK